MREVGREEAIQQALKTEVLYREAKSEGYKLTDAEKTDVATKADKLLKEDLTKEQKKLTGFTKDYLTEYIGKTTLVDRYHKEKVDSFSIDDEGIKASINYDDYRQYDIQLLKISTKITDESGNSVDMTAEEKAAAKDKLSKLYEDAKKSTDWSTLLPEDEKEITFTEDNFLATDEDFSEDFKKMMMAMENNAVSDIYETEDGYYIVKMINNNSTESYDNVVKEAITTAEEDEFSKLYSEILAKYKYKINDKELNTITLGNITLVQ
jgi:foldase protein PrsA